MKLLLNSSNMLRPSKGMALVIEDSKEIVAEGSKLKEMGFQSTEEKGAGVTGTILSVAENDIGAKEGDRVIFSKFVAEHLDGVQDGGKEVERLRVIPIDCILAFIDA
jgi:hypothetical protein